MMHDTPFTACILLAFEGKIPLSRHVPEIELSESVRNIEMNSQHAENHAMQECFKIYMARSLCVPTCTSEDRHENFFVLHVPFVVS
jgi:hypothetical protein